MSFATSIGLLSLIASPAAAFWRLPCKTPLVTERADPIVAPGKVAGHVHQIMGGNGFDFTMNYSSTQDSRCTSCTVHGDFSNYWTPILYYQHQNGSFEKVDQVGGGTVYYLQRGGPNNDKLKAFPKEFRMISGDPFKRAPGEDFASQAISYNCLGHTPGLPETGGFPDVNCPDGLRAQVFFPSCWDGVNHDMPDHKSHMSFPIGAYNNGACPEGFPEHLISIFYEITFAVDKFKDMWYGDHQPFVWSMGDPTGYGFHGDFVMGWDQDILQRAVDECTNDSGRVEDCPVFNLYPDNVAEGCTMPTRIDEPISGMLDALPGCNPVQQGPDEAQIIQNCAVNSTIGAGKPTFTDLTSSGWGYQGCGTDNYYNRAFTGATTSDKAMTNEACVAFCDSKGFSIAGSEYADECYCANSIPTSAQPIPGVPGSCNMPCAGDSTQMCGGSGTLTIYQKCTGSTCANSPNVPGQGSAAGKPPVSSAGGVGSLTTTRPATSTTAAMSIISNGSPSFSSISSATSQGAVANPTTSASGQSGNGPKPPTSTGSSHDQANPTNTGSPSAGSQLSPPSDTGKPAVTLINPTASASVKPGSPTSLPLPSGWSYVNCMSDVVPQRVLSHLAPYTLNNTLVTSTACVDYCSSKGFSYAGTEYAGECFCGTTLDTGSSKLEASKCDMGCKGDATQVCGGWAAMTLFSNATTPTGGWASWNGTSSKRSADDESAKAHAHLMRHIAARRERRYTRGSGGLH